ncbi:hypothetical protein JHK87_009971 [Glycine soja]|nr:hypothetical protein JHK87_009971 [Glycine soja]
MEKNHAEYMKAERDIWTKIEHPFVVQLRYSFQVNEIAWNMTGEMFFLTTGYGNIIMKSTSPSAPPSMSLSPQPPIPPLSLPPPIPPSLSLP